jgi:hypothetical protein
MPYNQSLLWTRSLRSLSIKLRRYVKNMNIKKIVWLLIFSASATSASDFTGTWSIVYPIDGVEKVNKTFELYLKQTGDNICGLHFGLAKGGAKIDSSFGSEAKATVSGNVLNGKAEISIVSSQTEHPVTGSIVKKEGNILWRTSVPEKHRVITIPKFATMTQVAKTESGYKNIDSLCQ